MRPSPAGEAQLVEVVTNHPKATAIGLAHGVEILNGTTTPAGKIDDAFINLSRLRNKRTQILGSADNTKGDVMRALINFMHKNPGFIVEFHLNPLIVCVRTRFMRDVAVHEEYPEAPLNGMVSDGAHKFFRDQEFILMGSSVFDKTLGRWCPVLFSWMCGAAASQYRLHFLCLFKGIRERLLELDHRDFNVSNFDRLVLQVLDYSGAQRVGFIEAYFDFCQFYRDELQDTRTDKQIEEAATSLMKGCLKHFGSGVERVAKSDTVIPQGEKTQFKNRAMGLRHMSSVVELNNEVKGIISKWPLTAAFFAYWNQEDVAKMLLEARRTMEDKRWKGLPDTTNAQESMHWYIYQAVGKNHGFIGGLMSLVILARKFKQDFMARQRGHTTDYGQISKDQKLTSTSIINEDNVEVHEEGSDDYLKDENSKEDDSDERAEEVYSDERAKGEISSLIPSVEHVPRFRIIPTNAEENLSDQRMKAPTSVNIPFAEHIPRDGDLNATDQAVPDQKEGRAPDTPKTLQGPLVIDSVPVAPSPRKKKSKISTRRAGTTSPSKTAAVSNKRNISPLKNTSPRKRRKGNNMTYKGDDQAEAYGPQNETSIIIGEGSGIDEAPVDASVDKRLLAYGKSLDKAIGRAQRITSLFLGRPGCSFLQNSCWLDTSLQLLSRALETIQSVDTLKHSVDLLPETAPLRLLLDGLFARHPVQPTDPGATAMFDQHRNKLREKLQEIGLIKDQMSPSPLFAWLLGTVRHAHENNLLGEARDLLGMFAHLTVSWRQCFGSASTGGIHYEVNQRASVNFSILTLRKDQSIEEWFRHRFELNEHMDMIEGKEPCWRNTDHYRKNIHYPGVCRGQSRSGLKACSAPLVLLIEFDHSLRVPLWERGVDGGDDSEIEMTGVVERLGKTGNDMEPPLRLSLPKGKGTLTYDLIGVAFQSTGEGLKHFTARYWHPGDKTLYHYDDMQNGGQGTKVKDGKKLWLVDSKTYPKGVVLHELVYVLQGGQGAQARYAKQVVRHFKHKFSLVLHSDKDSGIPSISFENKDFKVWIGSRPWKSKISSLSKVETREYIRKRVLELKSSVTSEVDASLDSSGRALGGENAGQGKHGLEVDEEDDGVGVDEEQADDHIVNTGPREDVKVEIDMLKVNEDAQAEEKVNANLSWLARMVKTMEEELRQAEIEDEVPDVPGICKCGLEVLPHSGVSDMGTAVRCCICRSWMHDACQPRGLAALKGPDFACEKCDNRELKMHYRDPWALEYVWLVDKPMNERFRPGIAVLADRDGFVYPARLIHRTSEDEWLVKWWDECCFMPGATGNMAGQKEIRKESSLVDHCWDDIKKRRDICFGRWNLASLMESPMDRLAFNRLPHTPEFEEALNPHIDELRKLIICPWLVPSALAPVKEVDFKSIAVPLQAPLSIQEYSMLNHWLESRLCEDKSLYYLTHLDHGRVRVHAITLLVAHRLRQEGRPGLDLNNVEVVRKYAWREQVRCHADGTYWEQIAMDTARATIDQQCIEDLENLIFDETRHAGRAGTRQWGLDKGSHYKGWIPYNEFPDLPASSEDEQEWRDSIDDRWMDEGPNFVKWKKPEVPPKPKPKPRPIRLSRTPSPTRYMTVDEKAEYVRKRLVADLWGLDLEAKDLDAENMHPTRNRQPPKPIGVLTDPNAPKQPKTKVRDRHMFVWEAVPPRPEKKRKFL
ncbi:hypothetical protein AN958_00328 [Leucoagaricus sp. SymC.cos]|nr:hypothetical protein AN958_00328 [Leucoagaricus sp. SymC.cos]